MQICMIIEQCTFLDIYKTKDLLCLSYKKLKRFFEIIFRIQKAERYSLEIAKLVPLKIYQLFAGIIIIEKMNNYDNQHLYSILLPSLFYAYILCERKPECK